MINRKIMNLQLFAEGGDDNPDSNRDVGTGNGGSGHEGNTGTTYSYEQAEEIANARANKAERVALANYFRSQGMTEDEITAAIRDFKAKKRASQPDVGQITKERDDAISELTQFKNERFLVEKGVKADDLDYVAYKANQLVTDKKDFKAAADEFLKSNPRFIGKTYQVSTGVSAGTASSGTGSKNEHINNMIRNAFGR